MTTDCPRCGLHFEKDPGYWLGSVMINTGVTQGLFVAVLVVGVLLSWPDVPWLALLIAGIAIAVLTPIVFHPFSRTLWIAAERAVTGWSDTSLANPIVISDGDSPE